MGSERNKKLIGMNAGILSVAALVSFVLPAILDSVLEGRGTLIKAMAHVMPLFATIPLSCRLIAIAGSPAEAED